ncbi:MAG: porin [Gammaproteobacteria bacterium]|nr:porin [Gammaproteobacteria bacterium]
MKHFTKKLLAVSVSLAAATGALAADKTPTLGEVLKASGVTASGYIDYSYNDLSTDQGSNTYRAYDTERRGFNLQMLDLSVGYLPASGFGGFAELNYGSDAKVNTLAASGTSDYSDVQQVYLQYASGPFAIMAGKFDTIAGAEVIQAPSNTNFSRSFLFWLAEPAVHTGVRATYAPSDAVKFTAGVNNGWNVNKKSLKPSVGTPAQSPTGNMLELGVSGSPAKILSFAGMYCSGQESSTPFGTTLTQAGTRSLLDLVATINATDALSFVLAYDGGKQEHGKTTGDAKWSGVAGYANYKFTDQWRLSLRTEKYKDKDAATTGIVQTLKETTLTVGYAPSSSLELRAEYRGDKSDKKPFTESGKTTDKQNSLGLEAVYKF